MASTPLTRLQEQQYLEIERAAQQRSECFRGEMLAIPHGTVNHARIQRNLLIAIGGRLAAVCEAFGSDLRIKVESSGLYTYPDLSIVCGPIAYLDQRKDTILNPSVLIEVLSPSTESYDRGRKFQHYQTIATLREYILVSQSEMRVERFSRSGDTWTLRTYAGSDAVMCIDAAGLVVPLQEIYQRVEFEDEAVE